MGLISNAKKIETGVKEAGKKKNERAEIKVPGVKLIATLDAVIKACEAAKEIAANGLDETFWNQFLKNRGGENNGPGVKPESFNAVEALDPNKPLKGNATVNVQCRKRGDNSPLKPEEVELILKVAATIKDKDLKEQFKPKEVTLTPELIAINPDYATNTALMDKVEKALEGVKGIPSDFIVKQDKKTKQVVSPELEAAAWRHGNAEAIKVVSCLGLRPSLATIDPADIGAVIADVFDIEGEDEKDLDQVVSAINDGKTKGMKQVSALEGGSGKPAAKKAKAK